MVKFLRKGKNCDNNREVTSHIEVIRIFLPGSGKVGVNGKIEVESDEKV